MVSTELIPDVWKTTEKTTPPVLTLGNPPAAPLRRCAIGYAGPRWIRGRGPGTTSEESAEIKRLKRENAQLKRANAILKAASVFAAELDRPGQ